MKKLVFTNFKIQFLLLVLVASVSCSVQNDIDSDYFKNVNSDLNMRFYDKLDTIRNSYDSNFYTRSFVKLFTDSHQVDYSHPISLKLQKDKMYLKFMDLHKKEFVLVFHGKLHKKKFVFYTNYETISFPVVLMSKQMERFRIQISANDELLVEKYNVNEGMFLFLGAGNSYQNLYRFKILENE